MSLQESFVSLELDALRDTCADYKAKGYRLSQMHPIFNQDESITLVYTFVKGAEVINLKIAGIVKGKTVVPSVTDMFLGCFVYENEAHDLFGVNIEGNLLDFQGAFYAFGEGVEAPMTILSPAQLAAREKAAKIAAAKAAKVAKAEGSADAAAALEAEIAAKTAGLDPEKAAKVRAAMEAKAKKEAEKAKADAFEAEVAAKTAGLDPERAAKVRAAMEAKAKRDEEKAAAAKLEAQIIEKTIGLDPEKAAKVRAAMEARAKKMAEAQKEGE